MKKAYLYDFISMGSLSYDRNKYEKIINDKLIPGGAVAYSAKTSVNLGLQTGIITSTQREYPLKKKLDNVDILTQNTSEIPIFHNYFSGQIRQQKLFNFSTHITKKDIPEKVFSKILFVAPLLDEISSDCSDWIDHKISCLVPSGWFRKIRKNGTIHLEDNIAKIHNGKWDIIVISKDELKSTNTRLSTLKKKSNYLCVTKGGEGVQIFYEKEIFSVPAFEVEYKDLNGAGDVWAASFTIAISQGKNILESAYFANACSAISIKFEGLDFSLLNSEIYRLINAK
ncbi:MAG: PfkB family carbohydrate kinase [Dehalococcoidia bacterium]